MEIKVRTIGEHDLTDEMNALMDAIEAKEDVKGFAYAGSGKSTFLRAVEKYQKNKMGIYLCYNKSLEREARSLFVGTHVHIYTSHSYALSTFSKEVKTGFLRKVNLKPNMKMVLDHSEFNLDNPLFNALDMKKNWRVLIDICDCFIQTASLELTELHLTEKAKKLITSKVNSKAIKSNQKQVALLYLVNHANLLLKSMFDTSNECYCSHDGYVKYWQLSKPVINYDYVMFDETQDAPPVLVNVIMSQKIQKIFVGDKYQNIYQFKGGVNAMTVVPCESFPLSVSFRYGQDLADLASKILKHYDTSVKITGRGFDTEIIKGSDYDDSDNMLYIAHTNIHLLDILIDCYKSKIPTVFVTDNKASFTLMKAESILNISQNGEGIGFYKKYDNIDKLIAEQRDLETKVIIEWFKEDREKFMDLIMALRWTLDIIPDKAFVKLCTAHGSKGLESDVVMLADDFSAVEAAFGDGQPLAEDELNLIYVAVTRAKKKLILSDTLYDALNKNLAFTLKRHKPAKCMSDNLIPESYQVKGKKAKSKPKQPVKPAQSAESNLAAETHSVQPEQSNSNLAASNNPASDSENQAKSTKPEKSSPLVSSSKSAPSKEMAIVVGQSKETGEDMLWCPTDTSLYLNPNLAVAGTMGTGKTQTVKSIVTQLRRQKELNTGGESLGILIFDYKSDYVDDEFVNATGATVLEANNLPINPFALHSDHRLALMNNAKVFISTLSKVFRLGVKQEQMLKNCILAAYENKNIDNGDVSTYSHTPPTLRDVIAVYNGQRKIPQDSLTSALSDLYDFEIFESNGRKCKTLYDLLDGNVVVVTLGGIDPNLQNLIVAVLLDQFYTQMHLAPKPSPIGQNRALKKLVLVDEADNFMANNFPSLRKILKEGREFGVGCLLSTQGLDHFQTSENSYSDYMTAWIAHRLNNPKSKDVEQLLNTKTKQELENQLNMVRELEKHHSLFVDGKKHVTHQRSTMFWKLIQNC
ncbi:MULTISPECIES: helicase HerA domain-containing protein [Vibrio]|uniref:helicase HerA domain-containing protein n=1 Tax=Vibrio TaxID=662 RepID=UPI001CDD714B|nr:MULTISPECIES: DUF87 domain-containing protein [Vibrio]MDW1568105.1 DUF87 domain-containing protein [Vibrio sp. YT-15]HCG8549135.1 DUF87 domain-containing protein [Vibrio parahaemolyticus]EJS2611046.1 DUF87 domain-containing protein [Vibrio alginolyticus]MCA2452345.1 DUF87 domain-containing protein [Vibrio alginolyticus]MCA2476348.1 DUF87 domain-containing protein [Vibrio alginolyticus]